MWPCTAGMQFVGTVFKETCRVAVSHNNAMTWNVSMCCLTRQHANMCTWYALGNTVCLHGNQHEARCAGLIVYSAMPVMHCSRLNMSCSIILQCDLVQNDSICFGKIKWLWLMPQHVVRCNKATIMRHMPRNCCEWSLLLCGIAVQLCTMQYGYGITRTLRQHLSAQ